MRGALLPALLLAGVPAGLAACGAEPTSETRGWQRAVVAEASDLRGVAVRGGWLLVVAGEDRREVLALDRRTLRAGQAVRPRVVPIEVERSAHLAGAEPFATRGYQLGDLWDQPLSFEGIGVQPPDHVYLVERAHRVLYGGKVLEDEHGAPRAVRLVRVAAVPGGERSGASRSDWRDQGPGVSGCVGATGRRRMEDVFVCDRGAVDATVLTLRQLDRFGLPLGTVVAELPDEAHGPVEDLAYGSAGFVALGHGGVLLPLVEDGQARRWRAGARVALPASREPWRGVAEAPDGTRYLVGGGPEGELAWRVGAGER